MHITFAFNFGRSKPKTNLKSDKSNDAVIDKTLDRIVYFWVKHGSKRPR